jgi:hypothetical protein
MMARLLTPFCVAVALSSLGAQEVRQIPEVRRVSPDPLVLAPDMYHLGDTTTAWPEAPADPEGRELEIPFRAQANSREQTLRLRSFNVDNGWRIELNGSPIGELKRVSEWLTDHVAVPANTLVDGENLLRIVPVTRHRDDILIGDIRLHSQSFRELFDLQPVTVRVSDSRGQPLPAKVTVADLEGNAPEIYYAQSINTAVRPGMVYTANGAARMELPTGTYTFYATRGMEWGLAEATVEVGAGGIDDLRLVIDREVDTTGYVAMDSHIHTYTHSGHGDATVEERMVTLAAEGVELAVATDHNHNTDYRPTQESMGLIEEFTSVTGNEVSTGVGHMNAFPLDPADSVPNNDLMDWVKLVEDIRSHGAKVVVLNHPRWPEIHTGPLAVGGFNRISGEFADQRPFPFDGVEVINTTTVAHGPLYLFRDWFALRNYGYRVTAVGTSDSHTVGDPVGQGRTYLPSASDRPTEIDVDAAFDAMVRGQSSISMGMFCEVTVQGRRMGGQVQVRDRHVTAEFRVAAPSWVRPRQAMVFLNGVMVGLSPIPTVVGEPTDVRLRFEVDTPAHDAYLVCVAVGDGVGEPFWPTLEDFTLCGTNPIFLDVDGDGTVLAPRAQAQAILDRVGTGIEPLRQALREVDDAVAVSILSLALHVYEAENPDDTLAARNQLHSLAEGGSRRPVFTEYLASLPPLDGN